MKFLIYPAVDGNELQEIQSVSSEVDVLNLASENQALEIIPEVDAMYGRITPELLARAKKLRWIQTPMAGLEHYMFPALAQSDVTLSNMQGIYSDNIADHVMGYILMFARGFHIFLRQQLQRNWAKEAPVLHLADTTLGVIGLGGIGTAVAKRGAAAEMRVIATNAVEIEKPDFVDALWGIDQLDQLLAQSDFVVSCVPHTPETFKLINTDQFKQMKKTGYLINISRGVVVDLAALTAALEAGEIAGAGLDVFETEPLPADHPLWGMENVIITPHTAGAGPHTRERRIEVVTANLRRFVAGEPVRNVVDKNRWC
ncbi:D-2-hydroxyacid dehydrogenase [Candidatus Poribacteria bacterium]|nr:MAG: D-2-hydroxyacid dehydrogenase [Candidatus Poribacteria bacterium]